MRIRSIQFWVDRIFQESLKPVEKRFMGKNYMPRNKEEEQNYLIAEYLVLNRNKNRWKVAA